MGFLRLLYLAAQVLVKGLRAAVLRRLLCWSPSGYRLGWRFISCSRSMLQPAIRITVTVAFGCFGSVGGFGSEIPDACLAEKGPARSGRDFMSRTTS